MDTTVLTAAAALAETPALPTASTLNDTMTNIGTVVSGLLEHVITPIMGFMLATPLCVVGLGLVFCGAGFGFVKRALKTSRK
ncbi:MAG: hypothetical protein K2O14_08635 [Oscillospiraceae bacterium]|nr:hypothetical protein [Oscillospiraceae bacterium]